jgi:signal transduction histidine kinase
MLRDVKGDIQAALADIRRVVYELRPPALDDLGLAASLRLLAERYAGPNLAVACDMPPSLPPLPAAVEVATYRISAEALTNIVRHSAASNCRLTLHLADQLHLEIDDNGRGLPAGTPLGVGLLSMRERAAELGGTCRIDSIPGGGTKISVRLPLTSEPAAGVRSSQ